MENNQDMKNIEGLIPWVGMDGKLIPTICVDGKLIPMTICQDGKEVEVKKWIFIQDQNGLSLIVNIGKKKK